MLQHLSPAGHAMPSNIQKIQAENIFTFAKQQSHQVIDRKQLDHNYEEPLFMVDFD
jgi:hypothetical protein